MNNQQAKIFAASLGGTPPHQFVAVDIF